MGCKMVDSVESKNAPALLNARSMGRERGSTSSSAALEAAATASSTAARGEVVHRWETAANHDACEG